MLHVADHFDYSQDTTWLSDTGYPLLLKQVSLFWLSQLQQDEYFKDGTLVVNPCSSPEHGPVSPLLSFSYIGSSNSSDNLWLHPLPATPPLSLHKHAPSRHPPLRPRHRLPTIPQHHPRNPRQRPPHRLLVPNPGMETRPRHPKRHPPPPLQPHRLVPGLKHIFLSLRLQHKHHDPILHRNDPPIPRSRHRRRKRRLGESLARGVLGSTQ